jgi:SAM-dependent methyltransferase
MNKEFENLKELLISSEWPESVLDFQIVDENSEQEKMDRAEGVIDILIQEDLKGKKFLDFGCGEGHMAKYASTQCLLSVGYDIADPKTNSFVWEKKENNFLLTKNYENVTKNGPYDVILIYDVIDHIVGNEEQKEVLKKASELLSTDGHIYLRCHPWCSRHGGHLYRQINKAFIHLVFNKDEIKEMGYTIEGPMSNVIYPVLYYAKLVRESGLKPKSEPELERQNVEDYFKNNEIISNRLKKSIPLANDEFPSFQMSICFIDYILHK